MTALNRYEGSCHCGAVKFEVTMAPPTKAFACNCTMCSRAGWLLAFAKDDTFKILHGEDAVTDYQFGKKKIHHVFCKTCGTRLCTWRTNGSAAGIALAVFDDRHAFAPTEHIWVAEKMAWVKLEDGLPQYPGTAPP